ncbi:MAG: N-6 DNA methylase, partial [Thermodesulfobacteriota bacterium]
MVQLKLVPVVTKNLFSKHYLEDRIRRHSRWEKPVEYKDYFQKIKDVYLKEKNHVTGYNEDQLERYFIWPILEILGHRFEIQEKSDESALTPDYAFFESDNARREAHQRIGGAEFYKTAIAIGDAKKWNLPLDKKVKGKKKYDFFNPSFQIDIYLRENDKDWGILTNGKLWRLYYRGTSQKLDSYYEVDLETILESDDLSAFRYFYVFFEKEALVRDETGKNFLDRVYGEGLSYSKKIGEDLQKNIYESLRTLSQGFLSYPGNSLGKDEAAVKLIHDNSLIYLYRLLFILYADARGMIQTKKKGHEAYDIDKIKTRVFTKKQEGQLSEYSTETWDRLNNLFKLIDRGSESLQLPKEEIYVPPYNGGLFDIERYPFLNEYKVGDKAIADVLEYVTMSEDESGKDFIDYSNLEIRHLGSVYEGLLEYRLKIAETDMFVKKIKKGEVWESREEFGGDFDALPDGRKVKHGDIYLVTDKGERKATGSYYTPDYIVEYIVENTLGPVVDKKIKGIPDEEKVGAILSIRVLDPAMGSGHFLVEASNYLARRIAEFVKPEDIGGASEIDWARREVVKKCIYGVDLNPLAMELAKLSLWLDSLEGDRPLSFLDHHIKTGNSLIGADLKNLNSHPKEAEGKTAPTFISDFLDETVREKIEIFVNMHLTIMRMAEEDIADIKAKEATYRQFESDLFRQVFVQLANLHTSYWLGNKFTKEEYYTALEAFRQFTHDRSKWEAVKEEEYFKKAQKLAEEKRFFNWELAFPDIFYGESEENPGFDAVIGNPPWKRISATAVEKEYLKEVYKEIQEGEINFYTLFLYISQKLLQNDKPTGQIVPNTWLINKFNTLLRKFILTSFELNEIFYLCKNVFSDAPDTIPVIVNLHRRQPGTPKDVDDISVKIANDDLLNRTLFLSNPLSEDLGNSSIWFSRPLHQMSPHDTLRNKIRCKKIENGNPTLDNFAHASDG